MRTFIAYFCFFILAGCVSHPKVIKEETVRNSHILIVYQLGHSRYQFLAEAKSEEAEISSRKDDKILERKNISLETYLSFADQVYKAIKSYKKEVESDCRTPFQIHFLSQKDELVISGCRGEEEGDIGQVIKEGEHLFYAPQ